MDERTFKTRVAVDGSMGKIDGTNGSKEGEASSFRAHRGRFEELLRDGLDVRWETGVSNVQRQGDGEVVLRMSDEGEVRSSLVVGTDGVHSTLRKELIPSVKPIVLPFVAFNGKSRVTRKVFEEKYVGALQGGNVLECKRGDTLLQVQVNDNSQASDLVSVSWIFSRPARGDSDALFKPNRPNSGATNTPAEFFEEVRSLRDLEQPFLNIFDAEKFQKERILSWLMRTVHAPLAELRELSEKGVLFMGDAVHAEPILGGGGANAAILDGVRLAEFIQKDAGSGRFASWYDTQGSEWQQGVEQSEKRIVEIHAKL